MIEISNDEITEALKDPLGVIMNNLRTCLENTPPELASDIMERGIYLTGGGAQLSGLDLLISQQTGMPVVPGGQPHGLRGHRHGHPLRGPGAPEAHHARGGGSVGAFPPRHTKGKMKMRFTQGLGRHKIALIVCGAVLCLLVALFGLSVTGIVKIPFLENAVSAVVTPGQGFVTDAYNAIRSGMEERSTIAELNEEIAVLTERNRQLEAQVAQMSELQKEKRPAPRPAERHRDHAGDGLHRGLGRGQGGGRLVFHLHGGQGRARRREKRTTPCSTTPGSSAA